MFSSKKPKFSLNLTINELSNIPQISGSCFIELQIKDARRGFSGLKTFKTHTPSSDKESKTDLTASEHSLVPHSDTSSSSASSGSGNISVTTSTKKIHNFKCLFNYQLSCNLKFPFKKRENLIANKYLILRVFFINEKTLSETQNSNHHHKGETIELGKIDINLSEYLNFDESVTSKYLLKDSKVNLILSLSIQLKELPLNYDFHTQLQINDTHSSNNNHQFEPRKPTNLNSSATTRFNVPQFERKNVFGGLDDVIHSPSESSLSKQPPPPNLKFQNPALPTSSFSSDDTPSTNPSKSDTPSRKSSLSKLRPHNLNGNNNGNGSISSSLMKDSNNHQNLINNHQSLNSNVIMDPIISNLYKKILESTWDPQLHSLLNYPPEQCIDDIFNKSEKEFSEKFDKWKKLVSSNDNDDDDLKEINGLINEIKYRDDLRSWVVGGES